MATLTTEKTLKTPRASSQRSSAHPYNVRLPMAGPPTQVGRHDGLLKSLLSRARQR